MSSLDEQLYTRFTKFEQHFDKAIEQYIDLRNLMVSLSTTLIDNHPLIWDKKTVSTQSHQLDNTIRFEATTAGMEKITHHIKRLSQRVDELENKK